MIKVCLNPDCGKRLDETNDKLYCGIPCKARAYYLRNREARLLKSKEYAKKRYASDPEFRKRKSETFRKWYEQNKQRHSKSVLRNYFANKGKWKSRNFVATYRERLLQLIPKVCGICGKELTAATIIVHKTFDKELKSQKKDPEYLVEYAKTLEPICSRACLGKWRTRNDVSPVQKK